MLYLLPARSLDSLLFFSDKGKVYSEKVYQIPDAGRADKGLPLTNILSIEPGEQMTATLPVPNFEDASFCVMVTRNGRIKRVAMSEFAAVRPSGLIATNLEDGDVLGWAKLTDGQREIILVTERGQALRYSEDEVRAMGRQAAASPPSAWTRATTSPAWTWWTPAAICWWSPPTAMASAPR